MTTKTLAFEMSGTSITLDGKEVGHACRKVDLQAEPGRRVAVVTLELLVTIASVGSSRYIQDVAGVLPRED
jgi:hypothetical protein